MKPQPKVAAGGAAGAAATLIVWVLTLAGLEVPPEVAAAIATAISFGGAWLKS